jgi:hypothetical protein
MKTVTTHALVTVLTLLFTLSAPTSYARAHDDLDTRSGPLSLVVEGRALEATYGEWSARWWQWLLSIPTALNPNLDPGGVNCAQGQTGNVWFLAGTFGGGPVTRACTIPAGKQIFFPIINNLGFAPLENETVNDLRVQTAVLIDQVILLKLTIDGTDVRDLKELRVQSPVFGFTVPANGVIPPGSCPPLVPPSSSSQFCNPAVSDGFWALLSPLRRGHHVVKFRASTSSGFTIDVTYHLTIAP